MQFHLVYQSTRTILGPFLLGRFSQVQQGFQNPLFSRVPEVGLEPTRPCGHWILNPARLPIPPLRLVLYFEGFFNLFGSLVRPRATMVLK